MRSRLSVRRWRASGSKDVGYFPSPTRMSFCVSAYDRWSAAPASPVAATARKEIDTRENEELRWDEHQGKWIQNIGGKGGQGRGDRRGRVE
jgi:hypothetical protein